jgi:hypothetical protein
MRLDTRASLVFWSLLGLILGLFAVGVTIFIFGLVQLVVAFSEPSARSLWPVGVTVTLLGLALLAGVPIAAVAAQRAVDPATRGGRCRRCGYDLRPTRSTRCPECGEVTGRP